MMPGRTLRLLDRIRQGATDEVATFAGERCTAWARRHARPRSISADHPPTQRVKRKAPGFRQARTFRLRDLPAADGLRRLYRSGVDGSASLAEGERICVAERSR